MNDEIETDYYLFIWIDQAKRKDLIKETDFEAIDFCLVNRNKIKEYLLKNDYTFEKLIEINNKI